VEILGLESGMGLNVRLITPDRIVCETTVDEVSIPSSTGLLGILTGHAPLLTALEIGVIKLKKASGEEYMVLMGGFAEVESDTLTVLCSTAEELKDIDTSTVRAEFENATLKVSQAVTKKEVIEAGVDLRKAKARLQATTYYS
jgi:F-type H+-transporting ATPase subunit epsilon